MANFKINKPFPYPEPALANDLFLKAKNNSLSLKETFLSHLVNESSKDKRKRLLSSIYLKNINSLLSSRKISSDTLTFPKDDGVKKTAEEYFFNVFSYIKKTISFTGKYDLLKDLQTSKFAQNDFPYEINSAVHLFVYFLKNTRKITDRQETTENYEKTTSDILSKFLLDFYKFYSLRQRVIEGVFLIKEEPSLVSEFKAVFDIWKQLSEEEQKEKQSFLNQLFDNFLLKQNKKEILKKFVKKKGDLPNVFFTDSSFSFNQSSKFLNEGKIDLNEMDINQFCFEVISKNTTLFFEEIYKDIAFSSLKEVENDLPVELKNKLHAFNEWKKEALIQNLNCLGSQFFYDIVLELDACEIFLLIFASALFENENEKKTKTFTASFFNFLTCQEIKEATQGLFLNFSRLFLFNRDFESKRHELNAKVKRNFIESIPDFHFKRLASTSQIEERESYRRELSLPCLNFPSFAYSYKKINEIAKSSIISSLTDQLFDLNGDFTKLEMRIQNKTPHIQILTKEEDLNKKLSELFTEIKNGSFLQECQPFTFEAGYFTQKNIKQPSNLEKQVSKLNAVLTEFSTFKELAILETWYYLLLQSFNLDLYAVLASVTFTTEENNLKYITPKDVEESVLPINSYSSYTAARSPRALFSLKPAVLKLDTLEIQDLIYLLAKNLNTPTLKHNLVYLNKLLNSQ